jgi:hypothetical protein
MTVSPMLPLSGLTLIRSVDMNDSVKNIDAILVKILHWCDHYKEDFADLLRQGQNYHSDELEEISNA